MLVAAFTRATNATMAFTVFPANDPLRTMRLKRQLMGLVSYLMFLLPLTYAVHWGWMRIGYPGLALFSAVAIAINLSFFFAIRTGYSERFRDPTMVFAQIAVSAVLALLMVHLANEARGVLLMLFYTSFFFGIFGLNTQQFLTLTAGTSIGYASLMVLEFAGEPLNTPKFHLELLRFITLVLVLQWFSFLGGYVARLRLKLAQKNEALATALCKLERLASHDELTGVFNRRHLIELMESEKERGDRFNETFSVCILDIDHFKQFNDTHGHQVGDEVLRAFSARMREQARGIDWLGRQDADTTFGRYGGEEFLLVLPHTPVKGALHCIERIRDAVNAAAFETSAGPLLVRFSVGIAEYQRDESIASVLSRADAALYKAKHGGRNCSEVAL
jgi:diguanylate cyclase (GGDEF)-like protein